MRKLLCISTSFSLLILIATVTACGVNNKNHPKQRRALTENQLLEKLLETTQFDMVSGSPVDKDTPVERSQFWLVPKSAEISKDSVYNRFESIAGGYFVYWKYNSDAIRWDVYLQNIGACVTFPITADGLTLSMEPLIPSTPLRAHEVYQLTSDSICHYTADSLEREGLLVSEGNKHIINFPKNTSNDETLWLINFYYNDPQTYEIIRSQPWRPEYFQEKQEWSVSTLKFLQMGDSIYSYTDKQLNDKAEFLLDKFHYPLFR